MHAVHRAHLAGGAMAFHEVGPGTGDTPPLLLLHGWAGDKGLWEALLGRLPPEVHALAPDLPGHGDSPRWPGLAGPADDALAVAALAEDRGLGPALVVGHSYGCLVALHLALARPERVAGLLLSSPPDPVAGVWFGRPIVHSRLERPTLGATRELNRLLGRLAPAAGGGRLGFNLRRARAHAAVPLPELARTLHGIYESGLDQRLAEVRVPTLVLAGRLDLTTPPAYARALAGRIPGARLELVPGAGHHPMAEQAADFAARLGRFLGGLPAAGAG